jgi:hypothetical protein
MEYWEWTIDKNPTFPHTRRFLRVMSLPTSTGIRAKAALPLKAAGAGDIMKHLEHPGPS